MKKDKQSIVFFENILKPGAGMVNREIGFATELVKRGWDVSFLSYFKPQLNLSSRGISIDSVLPTPYISRLYGSLLIWPFALIIIMIKLLKLKPDILCVDLPHEAKWAIFFRPLFGYKVLFTYHGVDDPQFYKGAQAKYFAQVRSDHHKLLPKADAAIVVCDFLKQEMESIGVTATRIYNGIEHDIYSTEKKIHSLSVVKPQVLSLNRYTVSKGVFTIVKAFAKALKKVPNAELICFGIQEDKEYIKQIKEFIKEEDIERNVYVFGAVDSDEMPYRMNEAAVFANAALYESFGMPMAEAQACGAPCIAFSTQGIPEVVLHEKTGLLAPAGDINTYAENMVTLLTDAERRQAYSKNAVEHSSGFRYALLVDQLESVLNSLQPQ